MQAAEPKTKTRDRTLKRLAAAAARRIGRRLYRRDRYVAHLLDQPGRAPVPPAGGVEIRIDQPEFYRQRGRTERERRAFDKLAAEWLAAGNRLAALVDGEGRLLVSLWTHGGDRTIQLTDVGMPLYVPAGTLVVFSVVTEPEHRGRGYYTCLLRSLIEEHFAAGGKSVLLIVSEDNIPSTRCMEKEGFRPAVRFERVAVCGLNILKKREALPPPAECWAAESAMEETA